MDKLVSIALTTYNGEKFLKKQLDSIVNQTYKNLEIIICDDNSSDSTIDIVQKYMLKDKRIKLYTNSINLGVLKNFEKAISLCSGDYIALSDQDDIWLENKIEIMLDLIGDALLCYHDDILIDEQEEVLFSSFWNKIGIKENTKDIRKLYINYYITGHSLFFKKSLKEYILPIPKEFEMFDLWPILFALKLGKVKQIDMQLVKWRQHSNNTSGNKTSKRSLLQKIFHPISKDIFVQWNKNRIARLTILLNNPLFENDRKFILDLINYYSLKYRFKAFLFAIIYINFIVAEQGLLRKIKYMLIPLYAPKVAI
jgi:glycosyltransferase involved in cell wall biosynthesis